MQNPLYNLKGKIPVNHSKSSNRVPSRNIYLNPLFLQRHIRFMCKHDATIIEKKRITVDLNNVGKLVSEATQFSKVKNSEHQAAFII